MVSPSFRLLFIYNNVHNCVQGSATTSN
jgi:hypothetical protein